MVARKCKGVKGKVQSNDHVVRQETIETALISMWILWVVDA